MVPQVSFALAANGINIAASIGIEIASLLLLTADPDTAPLVVSAGSVHEALEILGRERFDVLLVDIAMPEHDGYELIRTVRAMPQSSVAATPAAALTAFARAEDQRRSLESGFQLHLTKPIDAGSLVEAVASLRAQSTAAV